jgi:hypothetical protein
MHQPKPITQKRSRGNHEIAHLDDRSQCSRGWLRVSSSRRRGCKQYRIYWLWRQWLAPKGSLSCTKGQFTILTVSLSTKETEVRSQRMKEGSNQRALIRNRPRRKSDFPNRGGAHTSVSRWPSFALRRCPAGFPKDQSPAALQHPAYVNNGVPTTSDSGQ